MAHPWRLGAALLWCAAAMAPGACAPRPVLPTGSASFHERSTHVALHEAQLTLHLTSPATSGSGHLPIVIYGSGDGGWFGAAVGMFKMIAAGGYPAVGFSSRALLKIEQGRHTPLSGSQIAESYRAIIETGRRALGLPTDTPAVLTGWSRGASLALLAAAEPDMDPAVTGIVAIGLPREEQLDVEPGDDGDPVRASATGPSARRRGAARELLMYPLLERVAPRRSALVQASGDGYLPAVEARTLFGADSNVRRFFEVPADNHRFGGGKDALRQALLDALAWAGEARP